MEIGLSQWSFHRSILGRSREDYDRYLQELHSDNPDTILRGDMDSISFLNTVNGLGVTTVDLVNILFFSRATDLAWLKEYRNRAEELGIKFGCLMCDELGNLGASLASERNASLEKHLIWLQVASELGCSMLRVNAYGDGTYLNQMKQCAQTISALADCAINYGIKIVIENHGFSSNNGAWLAMLIEEVGRENVGVYLDFDNFFMGGWHHDPKRHYDRTQGVIDLAPYTFGVSAKSYNFDENGNELTVDFKKYIEILREHDFDGVVSAEYEGDVLSEFEGTKKTINLIERTIS
ncbi:sugar phosphate isomerase/epimerase family protein [Vibrio sp. 10N.286.52.C3]|uniref:sugar phosphate isomerase/epimerase family protein n=1 Tax=Vibrio TaxID=662 RepID=UPI000C818AB2|nr:sugar phosphate isomerase/epimerase family protein [Vibrio cyclitrophicus]PMH40959.1 hypothetical protein BCU69_14935 [Vibrio cyclitrophicus]PMH77454.1 hypothetical protein BCU59_00515 [Vibrio cyclitrophicus]